jgi:hypothetical protein
LYYGTCQWLQHDDPRPALVFVAVEGQGGWQLRLTDGFNEYRARLPEAPPGLRWTGQPKYASPPSAALTWAEAWQALAGAPPGSRSPSDLPARKGVP